MKIIKFFSIFLFLIFQQIIHVEADDFNHWVIDFKKRALDQNISLKTVNISQKYKNWIFLIFVILGIALISKIWLTLVVVFGFYLLSIGYTIFKSR